MYYYYTVSTIGIHPWWKVLIKFLTEIYEQKHLTGLQIYQFVSGVVYTAVYFYYYFKDIKIEFESTFPKISFTTVLFLFMFFFFLTCK